MYDAVELLGKTNWPQRIKQVPRFSVNFLKKFFDVSKQFSSEGSFLRCPSLSTIHNAGFQVVLLSIEPATTN
jgi:hypothetical protein